MTINLLTKIYTNWIEKNNLQHGCAEELHFQLLDDYEGNKPKIKWLYYENTFFRFNFHPRYIRRFCSGRKNFFYPRQSGSIRRAGCRGHRQRRFGAPRRFAKCDRRTNHKQPRHGFDGVQYRPKLSSGRLLLQCRNAAKPYLGADVAQPSQHRFGHGQFQYCESCSAGEP